MTPRVPAHLLSRLCLNFYHLLTNIGDNKLFICLAVFLYHTRFSLATSSAVIASSTDLYTNKSGCSYAGRRYKNGAEVATAERCLRCLCLSSNLVCRLRVCSPVPDPPPPGCILLQRANDCCRRVVCNQDGAVNENSILEGRSRNGNPVFSQNGPGCFHNGTVYAEGSAMSTSSLCEYCYCIKGQQHCVKPQCVLAMPGCQPVFTKHSCCPIKYNCSHAVSTTTSQPIIRNKGCSMNGSHYQEGEMLTGLAQKCETCYCVQGEPRCEPVTCSVPSGAKKHCSPVYSDLHCCPTSYKCNQQSYEEMSKETRNYNSKDVLEDKTVDSASERKSYTAVPELVSTTTKNSSTVTNHTLSPKNNNLDVSKNSNTSTVETNVTTTESTVTTTAESGTVTIYVTTADALTTTDDYTTTSVYDVDYDSTLGSTEISTTDVDSTTIDTVTTSEPFLPTMIPSSSVKNDVNTSATSLKSSSNVSSTTTVKSIPPELDAILNSTQNKEHTLDYDYDYNESALPPSLPNLRIIPFVAADAVVAKTENSGANYQLPMAHGPSKPLLPTQPRKPPYYKVNHHNRFSPPTETEGGFLPKEPTLEHSLYDGKLEFPYHSVGFNIEITVPPVADQAPTANLEKMCIHNGKRYSYGDVVSEPLSCSICVCYYGEIVCQEPKCSPLQAGCTRIHDPTVGCCGRITCGTNDLDSPTRVIDRVEHMTPISPPLHSHYSTSNMPAYTIADIVSTPDPFRDVIRTKPAPDLPSLIGEIIHLWDQTTQQYSTSSLPSITTGSDEENKVVSIFESSDTNVTGSSHNNNDNSSYNNNNRENNNNKENINTNNDNNNNNNNKDSINASNGIDRIDVGFTGSGANDEEIHPTPVFKSNKTKTRPTHVDIKHEVINNTPSDVDSILFSTAPSKVVQNVNSEPPISVQNVNSNQAQNVDSKPPIVAQNVNSKPPIVAQNDNSKPPIVAQNVNSKPPIVAQNVNSKPPIVAVLPKVEVIESPVGSNNVTTPETNETTTMKNRTNIQQSTSIEYVSVSTTTDTKPAKPLVSSSSPINNSSMLSSTTPRVLESTPDSSFLFSTDDDDDSEAELKNEETDYGDNFSLDSVFKFFFDSGTEASETSTVRLPASETVTPSTPIATSRKPVSLKTPIFPYTTIKPSSFNKTVTPLKTPSTTTRSPVKVSPIKNNYFSSRVTAKPVKDIIHSSHKNLSNSDSKIDDDVDENLQHTTSKPNNQDIILESDKLRTEKPIIYINRFHSVTNDHKSRNRTATRVPGTVTRTPPSGTGNRTGAVTPGNKIEIRNSSNGTVNKFNSYGAVNRTPVNRNVTGIVKPSRNPGVYSRIPSTVSRISSSTTPKNSISTDEEPIQHISALQPTTADPSAVTGLLKLAGCNIYGRMYRVGKIITELSGPCLECMCTEVGVQCRPLPC